LIENSQNPTVFFRHPDRKIQNPVTANTYCIQHEAFARFAGNFSSSSDNVCFEEAWEK